MFVKHTIHELLFKFEEFFLFGIGGNELGVDDLFNVLGTGLRNETSMPFVKILHVLEGRERGHVPFDTLLEACDSARSCQR